MQTRPVVRHLLIDGENVPKPGLAVVAGREVEVTLLLGEKHKRMDVALVQELLAGGPRTHLIRVGASGRNALDLTLAYYLGRAAAATPDAEFFIVSRDTDYDAMIAHVGRAGVKVERCESIEALPFLPKGTKAAAPATTGKPELNERLQRVVGTLRGLEEGKRPKRRAALLRHIKNISGTATTEEQARRDLEDLVIRGFVRIPEKGDLEYLLANSESAP